MDQSNGPAAYIVWEMGNIKTTLYGIRYLLLDYNESVLTVLGKAS